MKKVAGVWIDYAKAVVVVTNKDEVLAQTIRSDLPRHPRRGGARDGDGETMYEARHGHELSRFFDEVIGQLDPLASLHLFGPGEAKQQLKKRLGRVPRFAHVPVRVESSDTLIAAQIVPKVVALATAPSPV